MDIQDRIKELRRVKGSELLNNPMNWRRHPASQANAVHGALTEIGYADAVIAYETEEGLMLIDGHLRAQITPELEIPVLITDLNPEEARKLLATLDPLAAMAETDYGKLSDLMDETSIESETLSSVLEKMVTPLSFLDDLDDENDAGIPFPVFGGEEEKAQEDGFVQLTVRLSSADRTVIMNAVNQVKKNESVVTTAEALVSICGKFSGGNA